APGKFFSVNLPRNLSKAGIVHVQKMQTERFNTQIEKRLDPDGKPYYWITGIEKPIEEGTDAHEVLKKGNIAIVEISLSIFER
ncbi:MAG: 5'/3'-nucleotidase SurE, partial [Candidatus Micrarchaeota archaeon]